MSTLTLKIPQKVEIDNTSNIDLLFKPYRENFDVSVPAGSKLGFTCTTPGQCLYYLKQATTGLIVSVVDNFGAGVTEIPCPAQITLTNISLKPVKFIPYREHFEYTIEPNNSVTLETKTLGQTLYYMAQANKNLEVSNPIVDTTK